MTDKLATVSVSCNDKALAERILAAIRAMPDYAHDEAEIDKDTRRGGFSVRYSPFVFHV